MQTTSEKLFFFYFLNMFLRLCGVFVRLCGVFVVSLCVYVCLCGVFVVSLCVFVSLWCFCGVFVRLCGVFMCLCGVFVVFRVSLWHLVGPWRKQGSIVQVRIHQPFLRTFLVLFSRFFYS